MGPSQEPALLRYEDYEFDVPVYDKSDAYNRAMTCFDECYPVAADRSYQALDKARRYRGGARDGRGQEDRLARPPVDFHRRPGR